MEEMTVGKMMMLLEGLDPDMPVYKVLDDYGWMLNVDVKLHLVQRQRPYYLDEDVIRMCDADSGYVDNSSEAEKPYFAVILN